MSICSATAAASSRPRGRPGRSASSARPSITEQWTTQRSEYSRKSSSVSSSKGRSNLCCVILLLTFLNMVCNIVVSWDDVG